MKSVILLKNCFVSTSTEPDSIEILHDVRMAIRDSNLPAGLVTITLPSAEAGLTIGNPQDKEAARALPLSQSLSLPFQNKELILDPKRTIFLIDQSKSGRRREFVVQVLGDTPPAPTPAPGAARRPKR